MKLLRYYPYYNGYGFVGLREKDDGEFCYVKDVAMLEHENEELRAERDRLIAIIQDTNNEPL